MKAITLPEAGGIDKLLLEEVAQPQLQPEEVLVKVKALSINPVDLKTRSGKALYGSLQAEKPLILGWDIAGTVAETGAAVSKFKTGDEVFGMVNFPGHGRAYAEFVAAPEAHLAHKPAEISFTEAAAATLAALTAWQVLVHQAKVQQGQRVLVHAAAGGVGHFAVQIAKQLGAYVIGTASAANADFLKQLGVDEHIDYRSTNFEDMVQDVDVVLDSLGVENSLKSVRVLRPGGVLISIVGGAKEEVLALAQEKQVRAENYLVHSSGQDMEKLAELLQSGKLKPHIHEVFGFESMAEAHRQVETGHTRGKVVVTVGGNV